MPTTWGMTGVFVHSATSQTCPCVTGVILMAVDQPKMSLDVSHLSDPTPPVCSQKQACCMLQPDCVCVFFFIYHYRFVYLVFLLPFWVLVTGGVHVPRNRQL